MKRLLFKTLIIGVILSICGCQSKPPKQATNNKTEEAKPDYSVAIDFINDYTESFDPIREESILEWISKREDVTKELKTDLKRVLEEAEKIEPGYGLGFDPIIQGQDFPDSLLILRTDSDYIVFKGSRDWPEFEVTLKLKMVGAKWLVDGSGVINIPEDRQSKR